MIPDEKLTPRERAILSLIAQGLLLKQIAERSGIERNTVRSHLRRAYEKLGARNAAHAVNLAYQRGFFKVEND